LTAPGTATTASRSPSASETPPPEGDLFAARRRAYMEALGPRGAALFFAAPEAVRSNDTHFDYRQDSDLWYLTGFEEPDAALLLLPGHEKHPVVLFVRKRDPEREVWDGARAGVEGAKESFGASEAFPIEEVDARLPDLLEGRDRLHYALGLRPARDAQVARAIARLRPASRKGKVVPLDVVDPARLLHEMRLYKRGAELEALRRAVRVSAEAHVRAMKATRPGMAEYEVQAEVEYVFRKHGARAPGYGTIVGSGPNACVLHYVSNRRTMQAGELLLVDAGAEVDYYTGDVTRTWPVSGRFSTPQREIYDLVLRAQDEVIAMVRPGTPWSALNERATRVLTEGLVDLGILQGSVDALVESKAFKPFYMHSVGHWLGLDVHDAGSYATDGKPTRPLESGMVLTVEPGLYFAPGTEKTPARWAGIGVRIEDDVLVTEAGCEVLSREAPKAVDDLEAIVGTGA
jgi:Xaa-Pro aminopeptidase